MENTPDRRLVGAVRGQYTKRAIKTPSEFLKFHMVESNILTWYVMIQNVSGNKNEFCGGQYLVRMEIPAGFPTNPPHFYFLTPNGVYNINTKVCIGIGEYHKESYPAALGIRGFCEQLVSGLIGWRELGGGIELLNTTDAQKTDLAIKSVAYNAKNNGPILKLINDSYAAYSQLWATAAVDKK